jgi:hypothetical protein
MYAPLGRARHTLRCSQDGRTRTDDLQHPKLADCQAFPHPERAVQVAKAAFSRPRKFESGGGRESNPTHSVSSRTYPVCKLLSLGTVQSVQRELNPHVYHGKVAGYRYIMDAVGSRASRRSRRVAGVEPASPRFERGAVPNQRFVCYVRWARLPVPAAGVEPAASSSSGKRSTA